MVHRTSENKTWTNILDHNLTGTSLRSIDFDILCLLKTMPLAKREKLMASLKIKDTGSPILMEYIKNSKSSQSEKHAVKTRINYFKYFIRVKQKNKNYIDFALVNRTFRPTRST